jgi:hypothetical protein
MHTPVEGRNTVAGQHTSPPLPPVRATIKRHAPAGSEMQPRLAHSGSGGGPRAPGLLGHLMHGLAALPNATPTSQHRLESRRTSPPRARVPPCLASPCARPPAASPWGCGRRPTSCPAQNQPGALNFKSSRHPPPKMCHRSCLTPSPPRPTSMACLLWHVAD